MTDLEKMIASLRGRREVCAGAHARDLDRRIAVLVRSWRNTGGKLHIVDVT